MKGFEIRLERNVYRDTIELYLKKDKNFCKEIIMESIDEGAMLPPTPLSITRSEAQSLINELWRLGFEPRRD